MDNPSDCSLVVWAQKQRHEFLFFSSPEEIEDDCDSFAYTVQLLSIKNEIITANRFYIVQYFNNIKSKH